MTQFSPRLLKGGLVQLDPDTGTVLRVISLQYNPDSLTRTLQVQATSPGGGGDQSEALRLKGAAIETIKLEAEIDATDQLDDPASNPDAVALGIHPQLAVLEELVQPRVGDLQTNDTLAGSGVLEIAAARGAADAVRLEQAAGRPRARHRSSRHRGGVRREPQPDPREGVARAAGPLGRRSRLRPPRRDPLPGLPPQQGEPRRPGRVRPAVAARRRRPSDARSAATALGRRRSADDDVPADEPLRTDARRCLGPGRRLAAGAVPAAALLPPLGSARTPLRGADRRGRPPRRARVAPPR